MLNLNKAVLSNIYNDILELSSRELQDEYWFNSEAGPISSFVELYCRLFDDNSFDTFVDFEVSTLKLPASFTRKLELLRDKLNAYDESGLTQQDIIQDPKWMEVMQQAKLVIDNWDNAFKANDLWRQ